jgi:transcriptional regulator with XRE-family HTH domain
MSGSCWNGGMWDRDASDTLYLLGRWIARWRTEVGVSQRSLAARAGIDQGGLSRIERALEVAGARRLAKLLAALDELSGENPMRPISPPPFRPRHPGSEDPESQARGP